MLRTGVFVAIALAALAAFACHGDAPPPTATSAEPVAAPPQLVGGLEDADAEPNDASAPPREALGPLTRVAARFRAACPAGLPAATAPGDALAPLHVEGPHGWQCRYADPAREGELGGVTLAIDPERAVVEHLSFDRTWRRGDPPPACAHLPTVAAEYLGDLLALSREETSYIAGVMERRRDRPEAFVVRLRDRPVYFIAEVDRHAPIPACSLLVGASPAVAWPRADPPLAVDDRPGRSLTDL